jgi:hypothetical protein
MSGKPLEREFDFFVAHQKELVAKHKGKFVVIKGDEVIGVYASALEAVRETSKSHEIGTFLVQGCKAGTGAYTSVFYGVHVAPVA